MAIISPRRQDPTVTQLLQTLGSGVDRFIGARRQSKEDEEASKLRALQIGSAQEDLNKKTLLSGLNQQAIQTIDQPDQPFEGGLGPISPEEAQQKKQAKADKFAQIMKKKGVVLDKFEDKSAASKKAGLKLVLGKDKGGKSVPMRVTSEGLERLELPEGVAGLSPNIERIDLGDKIVFYDQGGNFLGSQQKGLPPAQKPSTKAAQAKAVQTATGQISPAKKKEEGQEKFTEVVGKMGDLFEKLNSMRGIANIERGPIDNFVNMLTSSDLGQATQQALGTESQSIRNQIKTLKPTLINTIRQATEMGAKGMDSEKELEFYLSAVGNEKRDFQSNMAALKVLNDQFGLGGNIKVDGEEVNSLKKEFNALNKAKIPIQKSDSFENMSDEELDDLFIQVIRGN